VNSSSSRSMTSLRCTYPVGSPRRRRARNAEAVLGDGALDVGGGRVLGQGDELRHRHRDVRTFFVVKLEGLAERPVVSSSTPSRVDWSRRSSRPPRR
jgi:hypothetical protein